MSGLSKYLSEYELTLAICETCGTQYSQYTMSECVVCKDERQWAPPEGSSFTTLSQIQDKHKVSVTTDEADSNILYITAEPRFAIGQRAIVFLTDEGIWIWDCIAVLTTETIEFIKGFDKKVLGIVISHPHFYTTSLCWAVAFDSLVYISEEDTEWYQRRDEEHALKYLRPISKRHFKLSQDVETVRVGGHFPGSRVFLHTPSKTLGVADSIYVTPRRTVSFMWSYPNMIPLPPEAIHEIWDSVKGLDFDRVLGGFAGQDIARDAREVVQSSAKFYLKTAGWAERGLGLEY